MKTTTIAIVISIGIIGAAVILSNNSSRSGAQNAITAPAVNNVMLENGTQIVMLNARGGYAPEKSHAQAGIPTKVRFNTSGTFDCSASVRIPSKDISQILPQTGTTDIDLGTPKAGLLEGTCGMGMYPFEIEFTE